MVSSARLIKFASLLWPQSKPRFVLSRTLRITTTTVAMVVDVVRAVGPRAASSTVLVRLGRLPGDAVAVARAVSVLGEHAELPAVAALAGLEEQAVAAPVEAEAPTRPRRRRAASRPSCPPVS